MILKEIKDIYHKELETLFPKEEIDSFFFLMIEHYLGLPRFVLALEPTLTITKEEEQSLFKGLSQLKLQCPIQYILGSTHFMDLKLKVDQNVLIPRPETEELVQWILEGRSESNEEITVLDIGTGSGCIAISLAKNLPNAKVYALDISSDALCIAKENATEHGVKVEFMEEDILALNRLDKKFDVIVSNPPYVRVLEKKEMQQNVLEYEPELALFVSDHDPLVFYRAITKFAKDHLKNNGALYFEINQYLGEETKTLLKEAKFSEIELRKDLFGNDRMVKGIVNNTNK